MAFEEKVTKFWSCNGCGVTGPAFEGTASDVTPDDWMVGEVELQAYPGISWSGRIDLALCPDCWPDFKQRYGEKITISNALHGVLKQ